MTPTEEIAPPAIVSRPAAPRGVVLALLVLVPAAAGVLVGLAGRYPEAPGEATVAGASVTWEMPELIVNLAGTGGQRYLKVRIALRLTGADPAAARAHLIEDQALLRDAIIGVLSAKTLDRVESSDDKNTIRLELLHIVNGTVLTGAPALADRLLFLEFIVQ